MHGLRRGRRRPRDAPVRWLRPRVPPEVHRASPTPNACRRLVLRRVVRAETLAFEPSSTWGIAKSRPITRHQGSQPVGHFGARVCVSLRAFLAGLRAGSSATQGYMRCEVWSTVEDLCLCWA